MAGQSEASDDLIAELAKLMAQDAQGAPASAPAAPAFSIRIPGGESQQKPAADLVRQFSLDADRPAAAPQPAVAPAPEPVAPPLAPAASSPVPPKAPEAVDEPFNFDFDFGAGKPKPAAAPSAPAPVSVRPAVETSQSSDHDSIADLIAAELAVDTPRVPQPERPREPAAPAQAERTASAPEPRSAPAPEPRSAPNPASGWAPASVAPNVAGQRDDARSALRPVNLQPTPRSEQDRFKVAPVFGLGTTPAQSAETVLPVLETAKASAPAPAVEPTFQRQPAPAQTPAAPESPADSAVGLDPIDEIESLIGRAMRVELDKPEVAPPETPAPRPAPSPALRSLATPTLPPAAPPRVSSADDAIFAAAQATGAQVGWVEAPEVDEVQPAVRKRSAALRMPRPAGLSRAVAGPLVAVTLLLAAGFGLYWVLGLGGRDAGPAPLLTADATPTKQAAPEVPADTASAQQSVVFNEIDGVVPGAEEQLVSRDQADVNEVTQVAAAAPDLSEEGLANRKVRTVTVRPDGTIVSGDEGVAGSAILPVARPNVPVVPGAETASPELLAAAETATPTPATPVTTTPTPTALPATSEPVPAATVTPVQPGSTVPVVDLTGTPITGKTTVVPRQRPAGLSSAAPSGGLSVPTSPVNAVVDQAAAVAPGAIPAGATEVDALTNSAPAYVQLASLRSEAEARQTAQSLVNRFGPLFGGANMEVQRVDLGAKGIYYRVRVPASSLQNANSICTNVKAAGGDCLPM